MVTEVQLYNKCQQTHSETDLENYILNFPTGEHSLQVVNWWGQVVNKGIDGIKDPCERIESAKDYQKRSKGFRDSADASVVVVWNQIINDIQSKITSARAELVKQMKQIKGRIGCEKFISKLKPALAHLETEDLTELGISSSDVEYMEKFKGVRNLASEPLEENKKYVLPADNTEVYFWGLPGSGKTCCLGSMLSQSRNLGYYDSFEGTLGADYFEVLSNVFKQDRLCSLVQSTNETSIAYARYTFNHHKKFGKRQCCLIDLAGETFKAMRDRQRHKEMSEDKARCLDVATDFLKDTRNRKLHFFIVPYLEDPSENVKGADVSMEDFLHVCMQYLKVNKVFNNSTDGIYIIVTKTDMMPGVTDEERDAKANEYVRSNFPSLYNALTEVCKDNYINKFESQPVKILAFSIGELLTTDICRFDPKGGTRLIDIVCDKSKKKMGCLMGCLSRIFN
ncbi:MAG: hypothetical protein K6E73_00055 [Bacteroidales bacterium]|nr:hypothetical protein [Bacteroidales bacterium]